MSIEACLPISLLLQETLLASTWAWLALSLATIATIIRAFFTRSPRYEPLPPPPPPPPPPQPDQSTVSELENEPLTDRRREAIIKDNTNDGKRAAEGGGRRRRRGGGSISCSCGDLASESLPFHACCAQISPSIPPRKQHLHYTIIRDEEEKEEEFLHFLPSPPFFSACAPFEQQFGWDRLLEMKLGLSWACSIDPTFGRMNWTRRRPAMDGVHVPRSAETLAAEDALDSLLLGSVVRLWSASS